MKGGLPRHASQTGTGGAAILTLERLSWSPGDEDHYQLPAALASAWATRPRNAMLPPEKENTPDLPAMFESNVGECGSVSNATDFTSSQQFQSYRLDRSAINMLLWQGKTAKLNLITTRLKLVTSGYF